MFFFLLLTSFDIYMESRSSSDEAGGRVAAPNQQKHCSCFAEHETKESKKIKIKIQMNTLSSQYAVLPLDAAEPNEPGPFKY